MKVLKSKKSFYNTFFVLLIFLIYFVPRLVYLGFDEFVDDSDLWDRRSEAFYESLADGDLKNTYQSYHPGVLVMWLSGGGKNIYYKLFEFKNGYSVVKDTRAVYPINFYQKSFFAKLPLVFIISVLLTSSTYLLYKIFKQKSFIILFAFMLSLEPFYLGVTRHLHLSGLLSAFTFFILIYTFYFYKNSSTKTFPFFLGFLLGLSFLVKVSSLVLIPFLLLVFFIINKKADIANLLSLSLKTLLSFIVTILLFWPALLFYPRYVIYNLYNKGIIENVVEGSVSTHLFWDWAFYLEAFVVRQSFLITLLFVFSFYFYIKEKNNKTKKLLTYSYLFIAYYILIMTIPSKLNDRYLTIIIPLSVFIASFALYKILNVYKSKKYKFIIYFGLFLYLSHNLYSYFPNSSSFVSEFSLGMRGMSRVIEVRNTGEYYLEAIRYLRKKEGKDLYNKTLLVQNTRKVRSAKGFTGKFLYAGHNFNKSDLNYFLVDYNNLQKVPKGCKIVESFGPKGVFSFKYLFLYKCDI